MGQHPQYSRMGTIPNRVQGCGRRGTLGSVPPPRPWGRRCQMEALRGCLRERGVDSLIAEAQEAACAIAESGDALLFPRKNTVGAFNILARGLAMATLVTGEVDWMGVRFVRPRWVE